MMVLIQGTCGWIDQQYDRTVKRDAISRLEHYSKIWPSVEVNTSCYAVPSPQVTAAWAASVPSRFLFHFKAFGLFCSKGAPLGQLPPQVREQLPECISTLHSGSYVHLSQMPAQAVDTAWSLFHAALSPVYQAGKLGVVLFQFHLTFQPSKENLDYLLRCRRLLDNRFQMAIELRCRRWLTDLEWRYQTSAAFSKHGIAWAAADELEHETMTMPIPANRFENKVLPIAMEATTRDFFYVRVHRRHGKEERELSKEEIRAWARNLETMDQQIDGPVYFCWGTDHREVPRRNAEALDNAIPDPMRFIWKPASKLGGNNIETFFSAVGKRTANNLDCPRITTGDAMDDKKVVPMPNKKKKGIERFYSKLRSP